MALPNAASNRKLQHHRSIDVEVFARGDGLWEVDARLVDVKTRDVKLASGSRPAGEPIHDLLLRLVIDEHFHILEAGSETRAMPYAGECDVFAGDSGDAYRRLVGLNLMQGFRQAVRHRLGGVKGCTHLSEMSQTLPTAVVQAFAGIVIDTRGDREGSERPFQIDRCHALRADGAAVREHYPRWYRQGDVSSAADTAPPPAVSPTSPLQSETSP
jgi:hypothetical protein